MLYSQAAQDSNAKTEYKTKIVHNSKVSGLLGVPFFANRIQDEPYTKLTFEDGQLMTFKTEKLEFDYMAYIVIRELAERQMMALSNEESKVQFFCIETRVTI